MAALSDSLPVRLTLVDLKVGQDEAEINGSLRWVALEKPDCHASVSLQLRKSELISVGYSHPLNIWSYGPASRLV